MKKLTALLLAAVMVLSIAACGSEKPADDTTAAPSKPPLTDSLVTVLEKVIVEEPVSFDPMIMELDLTDTSESGMEMLKTFTGMDNADQIKEAAVLEPWIGSIAFSVTMVRVKDAANAKSVAEQMKARINPGKWVCVRADDVQVAGYGDVIIFVMLDKGRMTAQSFVSAFERVCGAELDFVLE